MTAVDCSNVPRQHDLPTSFEGGEELNFISSLARQC